MKKLIIALLLGLFTPVLKAQTGEDLQTVSAAAANTEIEVNGQQMVVGFNIGQPIYGTNAIAVNETAEQEGVLAMSGFPYPVKYFPQIFNTDFFVSKGFFGNLVQLQWDATSDNIEQFRVYRKPITEQGDSLLVAVFGPNDFFFKDETIDYGVVYKYTVFAKGLADGLREEYFNYVEGDGFAFPTGAVSGQVKFEGGTAVKDVSVLATTEGNLSGKSIALQNDGEFLKVTHGSDDDELELNQGFSAQMWAKYEGEREGILFKKGDNYLLTYDGEKLKFKVGSELLEMGFVNPLDSFFHVSAIYNKGNSLRLDVTVNESNSASISQASTVSVDPNFDNLVFGGNGVASGQFKGKIDEIRLWTKALSRAEVEDNYYRYIPGSSEGLVGYWRLDMAIGNEFYDFARKGSTFWENHGQVIKADFSSDIPLNSQLAFRGLTDDEGNYTISGFPYESTGSLYKFTPLKKYHEFDPNQQTRFVGPSQSIHNQVDFVDVASFEVTGTAKYKDTEFPVEGVSILIDGTPAIDGDGNLILTDNLGQFKVDVPIGEHSIRMSKPNHVFSEEGRFPKPTEEDDSPLFNFQEPINGLTFLDETRIKVAGRVVGGPIEEAKILGFAKSKNNIGNATIVMETQKGFDITDQQSGAQNTIKETNAGGEINANVSFNTKQITINPDPLTGEFIAYLPPEQYIVNSITAGAYVFDDSFNVTLDLRQTFANDFEVVNDTLATSINDVPIEGVIPLDVATYDASTTFTRNDTLFTVGIDTFSLQKRQDFIFRSIPSIDVTNSNGNEFFGDGIYTYTDVALNIEEEVALYDAQAKTYAFNHPIFTQRAVYDFEIQLFEEYVNRDASDAVDRVPVVDGKIEVINELSLSSQKVVLALDGNGKTVYSFRAGIPNRSIDNNNRQNDFTKTLNITALSGKNGGIQTVWREGDPFRGIIFGSQPFGNNFVTTGPNIVDYILRDPPGSGSSASITKGETVSSKSSFSVTNKETGTSDFGLSLGIGVTTFVGLGAGVINEVDDQAALDVGFSATAEYTEGTEREETLTIERTISTSDDPLFVGEAGDVFIGRSTNIVYGAAGFVELIPTDQCQTCGDTESQSYRIGTKTGLNFGSQFNTGFAFSQFYIESTLLPNLKKVRNDLLTYVSDPEQVVPTEKPVYISKVPVENDNYGSSNTDKDIWGSDASLFTNNGPSYIIKYPDGYTVKKSDTIAYYNKQISSWKFWLAENEKQKVEATLDDNVSFESGAIYEQSITVEKIESSTLSTDFTIDESIATSIGLTVNDVGFSTTTTLDVSSSKSSANTSSEARSTTTTFTLADGDIGDSYTVDVKTPKDGFGAIFSTRGGQTACPYEPETRTRFYQPGKFVLNAATQRREGPVIQASEAVIANVPENRSADFEINLSTDSETGEPFSYTLFVDPVSNPNGAELSINGDPIGNGLSFLVKPGETITQTVSLAKGRQDVFDYEDIRLLLVSQCQFDPTEPQVDIADTVHISAFFVPGCSDIAISEPGDNWILNTNAAQEDVLRVTIGDYDLNLSDFTRFQFQYKAVGSQSWITDMTFYNQKNISQEDFDALEGPKQLVNESSVIYSFDMADLPDQEYEIRTVAYCDVGPGVTYETPSEVFRGVKDTQRPQLFGAPQPADGILSANDEIKIRFNEEIVGGTLTPSNFSVKGVLNNAPVRNSTSVNLDGVDNYVRIEEGLRLGKSSFTVEFKLKRNTVDQEVVVFSKGYTTDNQIEIGFTAENKLFIQYADQRIESSLTVTDIVNFNHYAITYSAENNELFAYVNDKFYIERVSLNSIFGDNGPISLGKSNITNDRFVDGNILDLRIWNKFKSIADVFASINTKPKAIEIGLVGYWPFDEAYGRIAADRARFRNATLFAEWSVIPVGQALSFDGEDDFLTINTGSTVLIGKESDFTIEMWLKGAKGQANSVLFSSGKGTSGTEEENNLEDPAKSLSIGFNGKGELYLASNGQTYILQKNTEGLLDDDWHHLAIAVSRIGSAIAYLDGEQVNSFSSDDIGGFFRSTMTIGALSSKINLNADRQDNFYNGSIDEFRIWNTARSATNLLLDRNARLSGNEFGLVAYYPFDEYVESQGIQLLNPTLTDQFINANGPNGGAAITSGGAGFTDNTPNITLTRPIKDVPYSFVVNGDELIITPSPNAQSAIERSILEISVDRIEDKNGNRLASPISFTAFVNRNLVKWGEESISIEKQPNESYEFAIDVVNLGGSEESYNISNLPPWLSAEPQSATLSAQSSKTVTFTVNSGLNNGYYNEDIYLTTDFGFNEKLNVDLKVIEPAPDWNLDVASFEFSMSIVAQLKVDGVLSRDANDILVAYVGDELRGVAKLEYVQALDEYMAFMDIYSNETIGTDPIEFRAFDADQGIEFRNLDPINPVFESNKVIGRPSSPQVLETGELKAEVYDLAKGFSWLSFNMNSTQLDNSNKLFEGIDAQTNDRVTAPGLIDIYTEGLGWVGTISSSGGFKTDSYYLVSLAKGGEIDLVGTKVDTDMTLEIKPGFNRISYLPDFNLTADEAFSSLSPVDGDIIRSQFAFAIYEEAIGWIGSLKNLEPGKGYLYYSNAVSAKSFSYPEVTVLSGGNSAANGLVLQDDKKGRMNYSVPWAINGHLYPMNMSMVVDLDAEIPENYSIAAFDANGDLLGVAQAESEAQDLFYLTIHGGNEELLIYFRAFDRMTGEYFTVYENKTYTPFSIQGNRETPVILKLQEFIDPNAASLAFPNPFINEIEIKLAAPSNQVSYQIYDSNGRLVGTEEMSSDKKIRSIKWDGTDQSKKEVNSGVYLFRIRQDNKVETIKVIKN